VTQFDVCVVGSANLDLVVETERHPRPGETVLAGTYAEHPGGKGLNQAVSAARSGARVVFIGALGDDDAGRQLAAVLSAESIDATNAVTVAAPTGRAVIVVDSSGENSIVVVPGANDEVTLPSPMPSAAVMLAQLEVPLSVVTAAFRHAHEHGVTTVLNPAPAAHLSEELLRWCDVIVPNQHEAELLGGADALLTAGCRAVIVTRGGDGVDVHADHTVTHVDTPFVEVVDTTGAGDAFCGALAARLAGRHGLLESVRWAAVAGAIATTRRGAVPSQPRASEIESVLAGMR
jgi:ribokinase